MPVARGVRDVAEPPGLPPGPHSGSPRSSKRRSPISSEGGLGPSTRAHRSPIRRRSSTRSGSAGRCRGRSEPLRGSPAALTLEFRSVSSSRPGRRGRSDSPRARVIVSAGVVGPGVTATGRSSMDASIGVGGGRAVIRRPQGGSQPVSPRRLAIRREMQFAGRISLRPRSGKAEPPPLVEPFPFLRFGVVAS